MDQSIVAIKEAGLICQVQVFAKLFYKNHYQKLCWKFEIAKLAFLYWWFDSLNYSCTACIKTML